MVAPIGSEVVLLSGIQSSNGVYLPGQKIEWLLSQDSVGYLVEIGGRRQGLLSWMFQTGSLKLSNNFAIGKTSNQTEVLTRGTPTRADDISLPQGQSWITVSSPTAGISRVIAYAPQNVAWQQRQQTATIHWIDSLWQFPANAIVQAGQAHTLSTSVTRASNATPLAGWLVRYEVTGGSSAGFSPTGETVLEVLTDATGRANVVLNPPAQGGNTQLRIQIIRPATPDGLPAMVVGQGWTSVTWSAPSIALRIDGSATAALDSPVAYRLEVSNSGNLPATAVKLTSTLPPGMTFLNSDPPAQVFGDRIEWSLGDVPAQHATTIKMNCQAKQRGELQVCAQVTSGQGIKAEKCTTTRVESPSFKVNMTGPETAKVGQKVLYKIEITNLSDQPLTGLRLSDQFDVGLEHADGGQSPISLTLDDLPTGQVHRRAVSFIVRRAGRLCHRLEVSNAGGEKIADSACINVVESKPVEQPIAKPEIQLQVFAPKQRRVGEIAEYIFDVTNTSQTTLHNIRLTDHYPASHDPKVATPNYRHETGNMFWLSTDLEPGKTVRYQINYLCLKADATAVHQVTVTTKETGAVEKQLEMKILLADAVPTPEPPKQDPPDNPPETSDPPLPAVEGNLVITVADQGDPIKVGQETTYLIIVKNDRAVSDKNMTLTIKIPEGLLLKKFTGSTRHRTSEDFRTIQINPVKEIRAGETLPPFRLQVVAQRAGKFQLLVQANSLRTAKAVEATEETTVLVE